MYLGSHLILSDSRSVIFQRKIQADNNTIVTDEDDVDDESILKWRAPQHRQFLSNEVSVHGRDGRVFS